MANFRRYVGYLARSKKTCENVLTQGVSLLSFPLFLRVLDEDLFAES